MPTQKNVSLYSKVLGCDHFAAPVTSINVIMYARDEYSPGR